MVLLEKGNRPRGERKAPRRWNGHGAKQTCKEHVSKMGKKHKGKLPPFVPMTRTTVQTPAWKAMSYGARCLYHVLRSFLRIDNLNNGKVYRSHRDAADDLGAGSTGSVAIWFRELERYGFIVKTAEGCLGVDGEGVSPHWRITECPSFDHKGTHIAPTRDFDKWNGIPFDRKTESRVKKRLTPSQKVTHTGDPERGEKRPKRVKKRLIVLPPGMSQKVTHNCLPPPSLSVVPKESPGPAPWSEPSLVEVTDPAEAARIRLTSEPEKDAA